MVRQRLTPLALPQRLPLTPNDDIILGNDDNAPEFVYHQQIWFVSDSKRKINKTMIEKKAK